MTGSVLGGAGMSSGTHQRRRPRPSTSRPISSALWAPTASRGNQSFDPSEHALREGAQVLVRARSRQGDDQALEELPISSEESERLERGPVVAGQRLREREPFLGPSQFGSIRALEHECPGVQLRPRRGESRRRQPLGHAVVQRVPRLEQEHGKGPVALIPCSPGRGEDVRGQAVQLASLGSRRRARRGWRRSPASHGPPPGPRARAPARATDRRSRPSPRR